MFFRASHENQSHFETNVERLTFNDQLTVYFMAKKKEIKRIVKLQITAGSATPAPPIGTAL